MSTNKKAKEAARNEALTKLRELVKPGDTLFTIVRHVARSGMSRDIDVFLIRDNEPFWLSSLVSKALDRPLTKNGEGVRCGGAGMNMCFELVYSLGRVLFPDGGPIEHSYRHQIAKGETHESNGGYLLKYRNL